MLLKGLAVLEEMFPGYRQELNKAGALDVDWLNDMYIVSTVKSAALTTSI